MKFAIAAAVVIVATTVASAAPFPSKNASQPSGDGSTIQHTEVYRIIHWADAGENIGGGQPLQEGTTNIDKPLTINCKIAEGCTVEIDAMVGVGGANSSFWSICSIVDSNALTTPSCWNQGSFTTDTVVTGNSRTHVQISQGKHVFQTQVFSSAGGQLKNYQVDYIVMSP